MKSIIAAGILLASSTAPAFAGPYANIENNAGWVGKEFGSSVTEVHAGYEFENGLRISARVENLFDKEYSEVYGYPALGRALHVGFNYSF